MTKENPKYTDNRVAREAMARRGFVTTRGAKTSDDSVSVRGLTIRPAVSKWCDEGEGLSEEQEALVAKARAKCAMRDCDNDAIEGFPVCHRCADDFNSAGRIEARESGYT